MVPLAKDKTTGLYSVIVDDTPTSPNQKEANWAIMQPMLAVFKEQLMGNPQVLIMVLRYSPRTGPSHRQSRFYQRSRVLRLPRRDFHLLSFGLQLRY
jgi:hypothetical protein